MKPEEALNNVQKIKNYMCAGNPIWDTSTIEQTLDMAIDALGRQIPMKPKRIDKNAEFDGNWKKVCPTCGRVLVERITTPEMSYPRHYNMTGYCCCGQKILWE